MHGRRINLQLTRNICYLFLSLQCYTIIWQMLELYINLTILKLVSIQFENKQKLNSRGSSCLKHNFKAITLKYSHQIEQQYSRQITCYLDVLVVEYVGG